jgi:hypothetical protein
VICDIIRGHRGKSPQNLNFPWETVICDATV